MRATLLGIIGLLCVATTTQGQLVGLQHVWTVPGLINTSSGLGTYIACSNASGSGATIGVEVYGPSGAFVADDSLPVAADATVLFGTQAATGLSVDINLGTGNVTKGLARVMAGTTKGILCSAFLAEANSALPSSIASLTITKKTKQKGD